jgi:hypothetical protein
VITSCVVKSRTGGTWVPFQEKVKEQAWSPYRFIPEKGSGDDTCADGMEAGCDVGASGLALGMTT